MQRFMIGQVGLIFYDTDKANAFASHLIPSLFGAITFSYIDANISAEAHCVDVFATEYIDDQAAFIKMLMRACLPDRTS